MKKNLDIILQLREETRMLQLQLADLLQVRELWVPRFPFWGGGLAVQ